MVHWYKHDPDAFAGGVAGLSLEEIGAYILLLDALYARDGILPDDEELIACILRCNVRTWRKVKTGLISKGKIWISENKIGAKRVEKTLKEMREFSETQSKRAAKGWEKRKNPNELNGETMPLPTMRPRNASTSTSTYKSSFGSTNEQLAPSPELLAHEAQTRPIPKANGGSLATAQLDSALAAPPTTVPTGEAKEADQKELWKSSPQPSQMTRSQYDAMLLMGTMRVKQ